jgi:methylated-DNA-[protein]-cysteine S-methyltransferase
MGKPLSVEKPVNRAVEALRTRGMRVTPQRRGILGAFDGTWTEHLTADEVFERARAGLPDVSRATVYNALGEFTRRGILGTVGRDEPVRFEMNASAHSHFRCLRCDRLYDLEPAPEPEAAASLREEGFVIDRARLSFEGTCAPCGAFERSMHRAVGTHRGEASRARIRTALAGAGAAVGSADTPLGTLAVAATPEGVCRIAFPDQGDAAILLGLGASRPGASARSTLGQSLEQIGQYFGGDRRRLDVAVDWRLIAPAQQAVLRKTAEIPYAQTQRYPSVGLGTDHAPGARSVGRALGANPLPLVLPCHRVVRRQGDEVDYTGGIERKRALIAFEREQVSAAA